MSASWGRRGMVHRLRFWGLPGDGGQVGAGVPGAGLRGKRVVSGVREAVT